MVVLLVVSCSPVKTPRAVDGILDLRKGSLRETTVPLIGEWLFLPGRFAEDDQRLRLEAVPRQVPDVWRGREAGHMGGTYALRVLLPPGTSKLALSYTTVSTAFTLFVNGVALGGAGSPSLSAPEDHPGYAPGIIDLPVPASGVLDLRLWVSTHQYRAGGLWRAFVLGDEASLRRSWILSLGLYSGLAAAFFATAVHALFLFLSRRRDRYSGYFALFSSLIGFRTLLTGQYVLASLFPELPFEVLIRLEYLTAYGTLPAGFLFYAELFAFPGKKSFFHALLWAHVPFLALIFAAPLSILTSSILFYYPLLILMLGYGGVRFLQNFAPRRGPEYAALVVSALLLVIAAANDSLYAAFLIRSTNLLPFALVALVLLQDYLLARRFTSALDRAEGLSEDLNTANAALRRELEAREEAQGRLETTLVEKELLMKEIHHRVKNSLQIVSSIANLQARRATQAETSQALAFLKERIRALSLVHEKLYLAPSNGQVDLGAYTSKVLSGVIDGLGVAGEGGTLPQLELYCSAGLVSMDVCADVGLILVELCTNAIRHAFSPGEKAVFSVRIEIDAGELCLRATDSGPGYPEGFVPDNVESLGFKIITTLVKKRSGTLVTGIAGRGGVEIRFPVADGADRGV